MGNQGKYWLFIKNHVFVSQEQNKCMLLYNTQNGNYIETGNPNVIELVKQLHEKKNLGTVLLEKTSVNNEISEFIQHAQEKDIFGIAPYSPNYVRPVQLMPVLNIQRDVEKLRKDRERSIGEDIVQYFTELTLYINNDCGLQCHFCKTAYKQLNYCTKNNAKAIMELKILETIAEQIQSSPIGKLNIIGGDIFAHSLYKEIPNIFLQNKNAIHYRTHYCNVQVNNLNVKFDIWIDFPVNEESLQQCLELIPQVKATYHFVVTSVEDVELSEKIAEKFNISSFDFQPIYMGDNIEFFQENIYLNKEDILSEVVSQRKIFCNQVLNLNHFGKLIVFPNGDVFANVNAKKLGNIQENSLLELLYNELDKNTAWRKTRTEKPCNSCLYQYLCPPISNYEFTIGKPNLCTVKP